MARSQLPLPFPERIEFAAPDFVAAASNEDALAWLRRPRDWPDRRMIIWGASGCGKTHLLRIWAQANAARIITGAELTGVPELPDGGGIAIDDADAATDQTALLHLLNAASEQRLAVLLSARRAPACWPLTLPDLASRVRAAHAVQVRAPDDVLLRVILARRCHARQLAVPEAVQDWLCARLPRTPAAMAEVAARLDAASLAGKIAVTRSLAARIVDGMEQSPSRRIDDILTANDITGSPTGV